MAELQLGDKVRANWDKRSWSGVPRGSIGTVIAVEERTWGNPYEVEFSVPGRVVRVWPNPDRLERA